MLPLVFKVTDGAADRLVVRDASCSEFDLQSLIIQQRLKGGDGNIFDCYGLCDRNGEMRVGATHLRIRQTYGGAGVTSYGEIPVVDAPFDQSELIRNTQILFRELRYHGIFGVGYSIRDVEPA